MERAMKRGFVSRLSPIHFMVVCFFLITMASACILASPPAAAPGKSVGFVDALFMAFSGISTTGLAPLDLGSTFSLFGQIVLLLTIQIGGIGYIAFAVVLIDLVGKKASITLGRVASEAMVGYEWRNLKKFSLLVLVSTLVIELVGALVLYFPFRAAYEPATAAYHAIFHAVNAFCTAGFSTFPTSLTAYALDPAVNIAIDALSFIGAIGFIVIFDLLRALREKAAGKRFRLRLHSRLVLASFALIVAAGTLLFFLAEPWQAGEGAGDKLATSLFQSLSASSTDGFNTIDVAAMRPASRWFIVLQMFTGAAPGSTGGGVKVTTFATALLFLFWQLKGHGRAEVRTLKREIGKGAVEKAAGICLWFFLVIFVDLFLLSFTEGEGFGLFPHLFETVSALGNTGLSMGVTSSLSDAGKLFLVATMFIGRVGPLSIGYALAGKRKSFLVRLPEEEIVVG